MLRQTTRGRGAARVLAAGAAVLLAAAVLSPPPAAAQTPGEGVGPVLVVALSSSESDVGVAVSLVAGGVGDAVVVSASPESLGDGARGVVAGSGASRVFVVGGTAVVSDAVVAELEALVGAVPVERVSGAGRAETAAAAARRVADGRDSVRVALANGWSFADVGLAGALVASGGADVVLYADSAELLGDAASGFLDSATVAQVVLVGGTAALSDEVDERAGEVSGARVRRLGGSTRVETAQMVARSARDGCAVAAMIANGWAAHDVGAAAALAAAWGDSVVLFAAADGTVPQSVADSVDYVTAQSVVLVGSADALSEDVREALPAGASARRAVDAHAAARLALAGPPSDCSSSAGGTSSNSGRSSGGSSSGGNGGSGNGGSGNGGSGNGGNGGNGNGGSGNGNGNGNGDSTETVDPVADDLTPPPEDLVEVNDVEIVPVTPVDDEPLVALAQHDASDPLPAGCKPVAYFTRQEFFALEGGTMTITLGLTAPLSRRVTISVNALLYGWDLGRPGSGTQRAERWDYTWDNRIATFEAGQTEATVTVNTVDDDVEWSQTGQSSYRHEDGATKLPTSTSEEINTVGGGGTADDYDPDDRFFLQIGGIPSEVTKFKQLYDSYGPSAGESKPEGVSDEDFQERIREANRRRHAPDSCLSHAWRHAPRGLSQLSSGLVEARIVDSDNEVEVVIEAHENHPYASDLVEDVALQIRESTTEPSVSDPSYHTAAGEFSNPLEVRYLDRRVGVPLKLSVAGTFRYPFEIPLSVTTFRRYGNSSSVPREDPVNLGDDYRVTTGVTIAVDGTPSGGTLLPAGTTHFTVEIPAGTDPSATIWFEAVDDDLYEGHEIFAIAVDDDRLVESAHFIDRGSSDEWVQIRDSEGYPRLTYRLTSDNPSAADLYVDAGESLLGTPAVLLDEGQTATIAFELRSPPPDPDNDLAGGDLITRVYPTHFCLEVYTANDDSPDFDAGDSSAADFTITGSNVQPLGSVDCADDELHLTIPAGQSSTSVNIFAQPDSETEGYERLSLTVKPDTYYLNDDPFVLFDPDLKSPIDIIFNTETP